MEDAGRCHGVCDLMSAPAAVDLGGQIGHSYLCAPIATPTDRGGVEAFEVQHRQAQLRGASARHLRPA